MVCLPVFPLHADDGEPLRPLQAVHLGPGIRWEPSWSNGANPGMLHPRTSSKPGLVWLEFQQELTYNWQCKSDAMFGPRTRSYSWSNTTGINSSHAWTLCQAQTKFLHSPTQRKLLLVAEELEASPQQSWPRGCCTQMGLSSMRRTSTPWRKLLHQNLRLSLTGTGSFSGQFSG